VSHAPRPRVATWYERLTVLRAIATIITVAITIVLVAGIVARIVEPETFTSIGLSYWWAITTLTTVGYGDVVPVTSAGRVVGGVLMLTGLALIPTTTSIVVSLLLGKFNQAQRDEQDERLRRIEEQLGRREP
jgi:voltage-gated potassium channel Kch